MVLTPQEQIENRAQRIFISIILYAHDMSLNCATVSDDGARISFVYFFFVLLHTHTHHYHHHKNPSHVARAVLNKRYFIVRYAGEYFLNTKKIN